jgi:hypothetical protein
MIQSKVGRSRSSTMSAKTLSRVSGLACGIALVLMLGGGASARQLPTDPSEPHRVVQSIDHHLLLMLKLRTHDGFEVLVNGK